ncbi:MAG TPA: metallophosphoesterase [Stellaceae bacterium]|nr:metallophosphoesterase [Stellaceae bacterium]
MNLWAISDLHLGSDVNRRAVEAIAPRPEDWLILAGDLGDSLAQLDLAFELLAPRFRRLIWVPGNHELWTERSPGHAERGVARYEALVRLARSRGVLTPEDPYPLWPGPGPKTLIAPLLLLYDYSFRPQDVPRERVLDWAAEAGIFASDERRLHKDPYEGAEEWCAARLALTERRLAEIPADAATVLVNHYPLRAEDVILPRKPRYAPWCGTHATALWHRRFRARAVVYGHLHVRASRFADGVHFQEVSLGYPRQWDQTRPADAYLRRIL